MTDLKTTPPASSTDSQATPLRCLVGSAISGSLAIGLYSLTTSIAASFAAKPIISDKALTIRLSTLVRTLVVGVASLGTFIFAFVCFGLVLLALQLAIAQLKPNAIAPPDEPAPQDARGNAEKEGIGDRS